MNDSTTDYQKLLSDALQKQMIILGPTITLAKARHVPGLTVTDDGRVTGIEGNPQEVSIKLLEQFRELSPLMVKKTMKPLLSAIISAYPTAPPKHADSESVDTDIKEDAEANAPLENKDSGDKMQEQTKPEPNIDPKQETKPDAKPDTAPAVTAV